jgi:flavin reductase (DIM6/NTAB) family NADH-FMN oxidoreductase RutF
MKVFLEKEKLNKHFMRFFQPANPVLVTTLNQDESINVAPFSWIGPVSSNPPMVSLALSARIKDHPQVTLENIYRRREFVLNIPSIKLKKELILSSYQYKKSENKFNLLGFKTQKSQNVGIPGIAQCDANIECIKEKVIPTGDHDLIIAKIISIQYNKDMYDNHFLRKLKNEPPLLHFNQYRCDNGQIHIFAGTIEGYDICFAEYPEREQ